MFSMTGRAKQAPTVHQVSYTLAGELLRGVLWDQVEPGPDSADEGASVSWRACAALYALSRNHPIDRRGRCRSCRRPGAIVVPLRRRCQVHIETCYWLHQPDDAFLLSHLAAELGIPPAVDDSPADTLLMSVGGRR
jgi:hypothetical protein